MVLTGDSGPQTKNVLNPGSFPEGRVVIKRTEAKKIRLHP